MHGSTRAGGRGAGVVDCPVFGGPKCFPTREVGKEHVSGKMVPWHFNATMRDTHFTRNGALKWRLRRAGRGMPAEDR